MAGKNVLIYDDVFITGATLGSWRRSSPAQPMSPSGRRHGDRGAPAPRWAAPLVHEAIDRMRTYLKANPAMEPDSCIATPQQGPIRGRLAMRMSSGSLPTPARWASSTPRPRRSRRMTAAWTPVSGSLSGRPRSRSPEASASRAATACGPHASVSWPRRTAPGPPLSCGVPGPRARRHSSPRANGARLKRVTISTSSSSAGTSTIGQEGDRVGDVGSVERPMSHCGHAALDAAAHLALPGACERAGRGASAALSDPVLPATPSRNPRRLCPCISGGVCAL